MIKGSEKGVSHRSADDEKWQECKAIVSKRDRNMCVLCRILQPTEYGIFMRSNPAFIGKIEHAHIDSVGNHVEKTYDPNNVVCLCHAHHDRMDSMLNPLTGKPMKRSDHEEWWARIKKGAGIKDEPSQEE